MTRTSSLTSPFHCVDRKKLAKDSVAIDEAYHVVVPYYSPTTRYRLGIVEMPYLRTVTVGLT